MSEELREQIAKTLFVFDENEGRPEGAPQMTIDSPTVRDWFSQTADSHGENWDCWWACEELRKRADAILALPALIDHLEADGPNKESPNV